MSGEFVNIFADSSQVSPPAGGGDPVAIGLEGLFHKPNHRTAVFRTG